MGENGIWTKYCENKLEELENSIFSILKTKFRTWFVPIGSAVGNNDKIWTITLNEDLKNTPLVMLHGFAGAIGFWCKNLDELAQDRPVYAIDLLGFGRSSRPNFASNCETAEQQWVSSLEEWRKQVNLEKFILLGHSFGGYLATSYTIKHPERVRHLILAEPWGFSEKSSNIKIPLWARVIGLVFYPLFFLNPLATVRAAGPLGPSLVQKMRSDIVESYADQIEDPNVIGQYIYQCNARYPSGESGFKTFLKGIVRARTPMMDRFDSIHENIPITMLYGENSWLLNSPGLVLRKKRENTAYFNIGIVPDAGHHVYAGNSQFFNRAVQETCRMVDNSEDNIGMAISASLLKEHFDRDRITKFIKLKSMDKNLDEEQIEEAIEKREKREITPQ